MPTGAVSCGTFTSSASSTTKTYSNLAQGIYYVKCTKYPAGVKSVTNSVFALPYYQNNSWVYTLSAINLANKVADGTATTKKEITNSTKNNVNYTDVSVGDTVEYALYNTVAGSTTNKLEQYTVKDKMSKGLTFNKDSVKVYLADSSKTKIADLTKDTDYKLNVTSEGTGKDTEFNVALNNTYLAKNDFYASNVSYVIVTYSAVLNEYAVKGTAGNPNEDVELTYGNNSSVESVPGNTVYAYTYGVNVMKKNENGAALSGAKFGISNAINEHYNESRIDEYTDNVDAISQDEINRYFSVAEKYNTTLVENINDGNSDVSVLSDYENILNLDDGVMGYVEIPYLREFTVLSLPENYLEGDDNDDYI